MQAVKKRTTLGLTLATALLMGSAHAELTANLGYSSEYYYRGVLQKTSSASGGVDFAAGDFSGGAWAADVGDGLEVDVYGSYGIELDSGLSFSGGFTGYYYTGEFDDTYEEINLNVGYKWVSLEYSFGSWDGGDTTSDDYDFLAITVEQNGFYGKYGSFGDEFDGDYFEFGYGTEIGGFDTGIALIFSSEELSDQLDSSGNPTDSEALVLSFSKTFEL